MSAVQNAAISNTACDAFQHSSLPCIA